MKIAPKGPLASRLRQHKFALLRQFPIPDDLLPGSLVLNYTRCGKPSCHCAKGKGHAAWSLVFMAGGKRHRSEEHTSELQSRLHLVCRLLLEKKKTNSPALLPRTPTPPPLFSLLHT